MFVLVWANGFRYSLTVQGEVTRREYFCEFSSPSIAEGSVRFLLTTAVGWLPAVRVSE